MVLSDYFLGVPHRNRQHRVIPWEAFKYTARMPNKAFSLTKTKSLF